LRELFNFRLSAHALKATLAAVFGLMFFSRSAAALEKSDFIDTNRPSFCQSALVVPAGSLQVENGALYKRFQHGLHSFDLPANEIRLGLLKRTELQMFTPNWLLFNRNNSTWGGTTGLGEVGIKQQFGPFKNCTASLVAGVNLPVGTRFSPGHEAQPVLRLPYAFQLSRNWALCGMQSLIVSSKHGSIQWQPFAMLTRSFGRRTAAFVEYGGFFQQNSHAPGLSVAHAGAVFKPARHHQIDFHFGFGMSKSAPSAFVGAGYSYRFDGLPWGNKKSEAPPLPPANTAPDAPSAPDHTH
jgi:hypothetical protein